MDGGDEGPMIKVGEEKELPMIKVDEEKELGKQGLKRRFSSRAWARRCPRSKEPAL